MICVRTTIDFFNLLYFVCTVQSGHDYNGSEWKWHCILCMANLCICACSRLLWALRKIHNNVHFNFKVNNAVNKSLFMAFFFFQTQPLAAIWCFICYHLTIDSIWVACFGEWSTPEVCFFMWYLNLQIL